MVQPHSVWPDEVEPAADHIRGEQGSPFCYPPFDNPLHRHLQQAGLRHTAHAYNDCFLPGTHLTAVMAVSNLLCTPFL